jgi:hypothetical protein
VFCLRGGGVLEVFSGQMDPEALFLVFGPFRFTYDFLSWKGGSGGVFWPDGPGDPFSWFWDPFGSPMISLRGKEVLEVFSGQMDPETLFPGFGTLSVHL